VSSRSCVYGPSLLVAKRLYEGVIPKCILQRVFLRSVWTTAIHSAVQILPRVCKVSLQNVFRDIQGGTSSGIVWMIYSFLYNLQAS
jgi:hypothetical protein